MFFFCIGQLSLKSARGGVVLLEERDIHRDLFAVVPTGEVPAGCAKTHQLSSLLHSARGDHNNRLFGAVAMLTAHMLT
jgi:hypothetical protein